MKKITFIVMAFLVMGIGAQEKKVLNFNGFNEKADSFVKAIANVGEFSGTILLAHKGEIKFHKGYGLASKRFNIPNSPTTKFRVGSVTKSFTAICILKLAEQGKLSLEDPLSKFHKSFPFGDKIKIKHLLSHTSGIKRDIDFPEKDKIYELQELVKMSEVDSLLYTPGTKMTYSNCGYILLQSILEELTGESYESYVTRTVLKPLELFNTGIEDPKMPPVGLADGFNNGTDKDGNYAIVESHLLSHGYPDGVGAMYSTTEDMMKFSRQIGKSSILRPESWEIALTPFLDNVRGYNWGFGFNIMMGKTMHIYNHNGRTTGFRGGYFHIFNRDITIVVLGNYNNAAREAIVIAFQKMLLGMDYYQPELLVENSELNLDKDDYIGTYETKDFAFEIIKQNDNLYVQSHGDPPARILPYEKDAFFCKYFDLRLQFKRDGETIMGTDWMYKETSTEAKKIK